MQSFQSSAVYVRGLVRGIAAAGKTEAVRQAGGDAIATLLTSPSLEAWWPQAGVVRLCEAMHAVGGEAFVAQVGRFAIKDSIAGVIAPLLKVVSTLGRAGPATFLARVGQFSGTAIRHVRFTWTDTGDRSGVLRIEYPPGVPPLVAPLWLGPIEYAFEVAHVAPPVPRLEATESRFQFTLAWG